MNRFLRIETRLDVIDSTVSQAVFEVVKHAGIAINHHHTGVLQDRIADDPLGHGRVRFLDFFKTLCLQIVGCGNAKTVELLHGCFRISNYQEATGIQSIGAVPMENLHGMVGLSGERNVNTTKKCGLPFE